MVRWDSEATNRKPQFLQIRSSILVICWFALQIVHPSLRETHVSSVLWHVLHHEIWFDSPCLTSHINLCMRRVAELELLKQQSESAQSVATDQNQSLNQLAAARQQLAAVTLRCNLRGTSSVRSVSLARCVQPAARSPGVACLLRRQDGVGRRLLSFDP